MTTGFDPYAEIPFSGYLCEVTSVPETYWSLMHFVEADKLKGVDEQYRRYLLSIQDVDEFRFETSVLAAATNDLGAWESRKELVVQAGMYMQLSQNKDQVLSHFIGDQFSCPSPTITKVRNVIHDRILSDDPWRRVLFVGLGCNVEHEINSLFNRVFVNRKPDEMVILLEPGISEAAARYAHANYHPVRVYGAEDNGAVSEAVMRSSHVFVIGDQSQITPAATTAIDLAAQLGKTIHQIGWPQ